MTFNEQDVNRDRIGRFGEKTGWPPEIGSLTAPANPLYTPRDEDFSDALDAARHRTAWELGVPAYDPQVTERLSQPDEVTRIRRYAAQIAHEKEPMRALEAGVDHPADEHLDRIWAGEVPGQSEDFVRDELRRLEDLRLDLAERRIEPHEIIGGGFKGNIRQEANRYLNEREDYFQRAVNTHGRNIRSNIISAFESLDQNGDTE